MYSSICDWLWAEGQGSIPNRESDFYFRHLCVQISSWATHTLFDTYLGPFPRGNAAGTWSTPLTSVHNRGQESAELHQYALPRWCLGTGVFFFCWLWYPTLQHRVVLNVVTNTLKKRTASIFRVQQFQVYTFNSSSSVSLFPLYWHKNKAIQLLPCRRQGVENT